MSLQEKNHVFLMDHFDVKEFCKPLSEEHSAKSVVWEKLLKVFLTLVAMATRILHGTQLFEGI